MQAPFFQNTTPDTIDGLIIGYAIIAAIGLAYVASLLLRHRNLERYIDTLASLRKDKTGDR